MSGPRMWLASVLAVGLFGCTTETSWLREGYVARIQGGDPPIEAGAPTYETTVQIRWLGTAGFHISRGKDQVLLDPFFSQQSLLRVAFCKLDVNEDLIEERIGDVRDVRVILIGHAHYDHLLDVPAVMATHATEATAYGSLTTFNLLQASGIERKRLEVVSRNEWTEIPGTRIRFKALRSKHSPHWGRILHLYRGKVKEPPENPPTSAGHFKEGRTFTYLIQFLDALRENAEFTIFYADSASGDFAGFPKRERSGRWTSPY